MLSPRRWATSHRSRHLRSSSLAAWAALAGPPSAGSFSHSRKKWARDTFRPATVTRWVSCSSSRSCCSNRPAYLRDRSELDEAASSLDRAARARLRPLMAQRSLSPECFCHYRNFYRCGDEPQSVVGLHRAAQSWSRGLLWHRRLYQCAGVTRVRCRIGRWLSRDPRAVAGVAWICHGHSGVGPVWLSRRKTFLPRSRRIFRDRDHQLRRSRTTGSAELGRIDPGAVGAHLYPTDGARAARPRQFRVLQQAVEFIF